MAGALTAAQAWHAVMREKAAQKAASGEIMALCAVHSIFGEGPTPTMRRPPVDRLQMMVDRITLPCQPETTAHLAVLQHVVRVNL